MSHVIKHTTVLALLAVLTFGSFTPSASAATQAGQLGETLSTLQSTLKQYLTLLTPAPQVAGVETIVVSNDAELRDAIVKATGGETIQLKPGVYGPMYNREMEFQKVDIGGNLGKRTTPLKSQVTITSADPKNRAVILGIDFRTAPFWKFDGVSVRPKVKRTAVSMTGDNIAFVNSDISFGDSTNWTKDDWNNKTGTAIFVRSGKNVLIANNHLRNIDFGIGVGHETLNAVVRGNVIEYFNGDGLRGLGDGALFENNFVTNPVQTDSNHSDGFQSWRNYTNNNRPVENVTVRNNTFLYQTEPHPLRASMQGIGMFDGPFKGWKIENNLVVVNHWHGISVYGGIDSAIRNNVVLDPNNERPGPSWATFQNTKAGASSINSVVENNLSNRPDAAKVGVTFINNKQVAYADYSKYFVDHKNQNWNLKDGVLAYAVGAKEYRMYFVPGQTLKVADTTVTPIAGNTPAPAPSPTDPLPTPIVSNNPTPSPKPTPTDPLPAPIVSNNPTPAPAPGETDSVTSPKRYVQMIRRQRVMDETLTKNIGFQDVGARGVIDSTMSEVRGMVKVNFERGVDGFMPLRYLTLSATPFEPAIVRSAAVPFTLTKRMRVMDATLTTNLGFQPEGARGTIDETIEPIIVSGGLWEKADFESGVDGYMPRSVLNFNVFSTTTEQREVLGAQSISLNLDKVSVQLGEIKMQLKAMLAQLK